MSNSMDSEDARRQQCQDFDSNVTHALLLLGPALLSPRAALAMPMLLSCVL